MNALFYQMMTKNKRNEIIFDEYYKGTLEKLENINLQIIKDLPTKCRICLREGTAPPLHDNGYAKGIVETLEISFSVNINEEDDDFPKRLCNICLKFIKAALLFRKTAKFTDDMLKQLVKHNNVFEQPQHYDHHEYSDSSVYDKDTEEKSVLDGDTPMKKEKKARVKFAAKVTCHICNKMINRSYYKEHVTMHDPDHKKYVCDVCGKSFRLRCAYHNHSLRHRTDFPYKCQFCPYRGRYAELLKTHMRTHTGDYRYMCTECPARFLFKSNLNSHMLKHKEPKFKCDACKRAFHTKLMLQRHFEADHLGIKNHVCSMCGKAFGYRNAMMKHQRHVHKREKLLFGRMPAYLQAEGANQDRLQ